MPELPEVETIRRGLAERLSGQTITSLRVRQAQLRHLGGRRSAARARGWADDHQCGSPR